MTTQTEQKMIVARGLGKTFPGSGKSGGAVEAVVDLDLDVAAGELVAFLGPNGAGKSTTLRLLTTLLAASSGEARVVGCDIRRDPAGVRRRIGYIGQGSSAGYTQRVRDELHSQGAFYGIGRRETRARADELIDSLDLGAIAGRQVQTLSGGQRRRVDIALGLIHRPELLFLDEPSTGLDPQSRANLWQHIVELRRRYGTTIFLTTHYLDEADQLAERVMVMDHGRLIADDTAQALKRDLAGDRVELGFDSAADAEAAAAHTRGVAAGTHVTVPAVAADEALPAILRSLDAAGLPPRAASIHQPTLDDVFLALTGRSLREEGQAAPQQTSPQKTSPGQTSAGQTSAGQTTSVAHESEEDAA